MLVKQIRPIVDILGAWPFRHTLLSSFSKYELKSIISVSQIAIRESSLSTSSSNNSSQESRIRPYLELMRWNKPTGTILVLTPALWSIGLTASNSMAAVDPTILAIFTAGAIAARGAGCTINDLLDRNIDKHVARTKNRPIASGKISVKRGVTFLGAQGAVALSILFMNNLEVIKLGLICTGMIAIYPLFKRFTDWPQLMLALTFNWGVLMGFAAVKGSITWADSPVFMPIYVASIFWTMYYDTIYAHQDKTDDLFIGVKSSALKLGDKTRMFLTAMIIGMTTSLASAGYVTEQLWPFYFSLVCSSSYLTSQVSVIDFDSNYQCWKAFNQQKYVGAFIAAGIFVSMTMKKKNVKSD
ncbi:4-hydroxybenzoate polyprenyltransferase, mitochondrial, partial [Fragariocoptes setiger]